MFFSFFLIFIYRNLKPNKYVLNFINFLFFYIFFSEVQLVFFIFNPVTYIECPILKTNLQSRATYIYKSVYFLWLKVKKKVKKKNKNKIQVLRKKPGITSKPIKTWYFMVEEYKPKKTTETFQGIFQTHTYKYLNQNIL